MYAGEVHLKAVKNSDTKEFLARVGFCPNGVQSVANGTASLQNPYFRMCYHMDAANVYCQSHVEVFDFNLSKLVQRVFLADFVNILLPRSGKTFSMRGTG